MHSNMLAFIDMLFLVGCFTCDPDSFELVYWGTCHRSKRGGLIVAWGNLVTGESVHWSDVGLKPRPLQISIAIVQPKHCKLGFEHWKKVKSSMCPHFDVQNMKYCCGSV